MARYVFYVDNEVYIPSCCTQCYFVIDDDGNVLGRGALTTGWNEEPYPVEFTLEKETYDNLRVVFKNKTYNAYVKMEHKLYEYNQENMHELLQDLEACDCVYRITTRKGIPIWWRYAISPLRGPCETAWREEMIKKWDETAKAADLELKEPHNKKVFPVIL